MGCMCVRNILQRKVMGRARFQWFVTCSGSQTLRSEEGFHTKTEAHINALGREVSVCAGEERERSCPCTRD